MTEWTIDKLLLHPELALKELNALSAAEPVAWVDEQELRYLEMVSGNKAWADFQRSIRVGGKKEGRSPLYAAPPAPSVAVKALLDGVWNAAVERAAAIANDSVHLTPDPGAAIKTMLNGRATLHPASDAALSAQVQDVAGWKLVPIEPTEEMKKAGREEAEDCEDVYGSAIYSTAEIYRAMLAAAPAKQEVDTSPAA